MDICACYNNPNGIIGSEKQEMMDYTLIFHVICNVFVTQSSV